ncbi:MAG TPA: anhydro-N-acetylmuramic acid kinase [Gemmatimonadaceae bacterium]|nr:anhydro-N-acetylmuramic acid kinase [Gemmatimonadaceae bacterium]
MSAERDGGVFVGLMSGTSLDGISAAAVRFGEREGRLHGELIAFHATQYTPAQRESLLAAMTGGTAAGYSRIAFELGAWLGEAAIAVIADAGVARSEVRAIGSHGQTLWHDAPHSTWQVGESAVIAERTGIDVVSDFRVADVAAGGQGAPLVPIADALLWSADRHWRALQNIGGIGNVTVVPPGGAAEGVRAFDTGPGVAVIDGVVRSLDPSLPYDRDGRLATTGTPIDAVVDALLSAPYFSAPPPKSTGRELFDSRYIAGFIDQCRAARDGATAGDIVATATALTARSIADAYRRFLPEPIEEVLISGGGAKNPALAQMIERELRGIVVRRFEEVYFDGEAKEAVAFALLAKLFLDRRPGNLVAVTGARGRRVLGKLTPAFLSS